MTTHTEFHFSPRANRAHEIEWQTWSEEAFERAKREDKPILLSISAVWCHWCHVMDETSYSDQDVIEKINGAFVPVRVDNDRRPDVNARYNQGGWPTTAFLTPNGALLAGATYLPPEQMRQALDQIADFYRTNRSQIEERVEQLRSRAQTPQTPNSNELRPEMIAPIVEAIARSYDVEYGGFGTEPKFPMVDVLDFLLQEYRVTQEQRLYEMLATTMLGMSRGGMYDHVEGGFFRYSTTRDWSVPHFEKMTEDHAGLIRVLAGLVHVTRNESFRTTLLSAVSYVRTVLRDAQTGFFAGSQDADEEYYSLPLEERKQRRSPYVDRTSYSNWTAAMAGAFVLAGNVLEDDTLIAEGEATLDALHERMRDEDGLLYHFIEPGGTPQVRGLLTDQAAYLRALLDGHEYNGSPRFLARAREVTAAIERRFCAPDGGFYDHAELEERLGNLTVQERPLSENSVMAESYVRLSLLVDHQPYREIAESTLAVYGRTYENASLFAAPYARALRRYFNSRLTAVLVGSDGETADLREGAHALPDPFLTVRTIHPDEHEVMRDRGFDPQLHPVAYVCNQSTCAEPALTLTQLREAYESIAS